MISFFLLHGDIRGGKEETRHPSHVVSIKLVHQKSLVMSPERPTRYHRLLSTAAPRCQHFAKHITRRSTIFGYFKKIQELGHRPFRRRRHQQAVAHAARRYRQSARVKPTMASSSKKVDPTCILSSPTLGDFKKKFYAVVVKTGNAPATSGDALFAPLLRLHFVRVMAHFLESRSRR